MDGYALRAKDSFGASASLPAYLRVVGTIEMGREAKLSIGAGEAARISTGGMLPADCDAVLSKSAWRPPPIFEFLQRLGVSPAEMFKVFNMGIGFVLIIRPRFVAGVMKTLIEAGEHPFAVGHIQRGGQRVLLR